MYTYIHAHIYSCTCICVCIHVHVYLCLFFHICICMTYIYNTCIHMYPHTNLEIALLPKKLGPDVWKTGFIQSIKLRTALGVTQVTKVTPRVDFLPNFGVLKVFWDVRGSFSCLFMRFYIFRDRQLKLYEVKSPCHLGDTDVPIGPRLFRGRGNTSGAYMQICIKSLSICVYTMYIYIPRYLQCRVCFVAEMMRVVLMLKYIYVYIYIYIYIYAAALAQVAAGAPIHNESRFVRDIYTAALAQVAAGVPIQT